MEKTLGQKVEVNKFDLFEGIIFISLALILGLSFFGRGKRPSREEVYEDYPEEEINLPVEREAR